MESQKLKIYQNRLIVADLIFNVLKGKISVSEALGSFPNDENDINIKCAFDALLHREADEDLRNKIEDYKEIQDKFLYDLSFNLWIIWMYIIKFLNIWVVSWFLLFIDFNFHSILVKKYSVTI